MRFKNEIVVAALVLFGVVSMGMMVPTARVLGTGIDVTTARLSSLDDTYSWILNPGPQDLTEEMAVLMAELSANEAMLPSTTVPYNYLNTFNFTNTGDFFEGDIIEEEEVGENLRNYFNELLYSDIDVACEVSILDMMLFRVFESLIVDWVGIDYCGFCNGMSQASRDYFTNPDLIPLGYDYAYELPAPSRNITIAEATKGDVTESAIKEYVLWKGSAAFFNPCHLLNWLMIFLDVTEFAGGTTNTIEAARVVQALHKGLPSYEPAVIFLAAPWWDEPSPKQAHFVNVYDYEQNTNGTLTFYIYDNRKPYTETMDYKHWILLDSDGSFKGSNLEPNKTWCRLRYYESGTAYSSMANVIATLIELLGDLASLSIFSPVDVEITDPLGRIVRVGEGGAQQLEFPAVCVEHDGHKEVLMPYVPGLPYTLNLTGTGEGDYRIEINRLVDGRIVTEEVNGTTTPGENDLYSMTIEGDSIGLGKQGVLLNVPRITSSSSVELTWSRYNEPDFLAYQVLVSTAIDQPAEPYGEPIYDRDTTSTVVTGLTPKSTCFFTVRVLTEPDAFADSNMVGAALPGGSTSMLLLAAGVVGVAILLMVLVLCLRRRGA